MKAHFETFLDCWQTARGAKLGPLMNDYEIALRAAWRASGTREMFTLASARIVFKNSIGAAYEARIRGAREMVEAAKASIYEMAHEARPQMLPGARAELGFFPLYYFSTQTDPAKYALAAASIAAYPAARRGLPHNIVRVEEAGRDGWSVVVDTDSLGIEILRHDSPSIREAVKICWSLAAQPRVLPALRTLPHGYEEANGLNYRGGGLDR